MVDTTNAEREVLKEKYEKDFKAKDERLSSLEAELQKYKEKELAEKEEAEKKKEEELKAQLEAQKQEMESMKSSFEEKLDKISQRASTPTGQSEETKLTKEEYLANREQYDTMALKDALKGRNVFD